MMRWCYGLVGLALLAPAAVQAHDVSNERIICRYLEGVSQHVRGHIRTDRERTAYHQLHLAVLLHHRQAGCDEDHAAELQRLSDAVDKQLEVTEK